MVGLFFPTEYRLQEREHMLYVKPPKRQKLSESTLFLGTLENWEIVMH